MKYSVIGAGLSGLTTAAYLAQAGHVVTVYEQHEKIGGVTETISQNGFKWDIGPMLIPDLGPGEPGRIVLDELRISEKVPVKKGWRGNVFPDFEIFRPKEFQGIYWRKEYFKELFPEDADGLERYYKLYDKILDLIGLTQGRSLVARMKLLINYISLGKKKKWTARQFLNHFFTNPKLQAVYSSILGDYVTPYDAFPGMILPMLNVEHEYDDRVPLDYGNHQHRGSWSFILNGCGTLVDALAFVVRSNGGEIKTNTAVTNINIEHNKIASIELNSGETVTTDGVIASGGARELFLDLVGKEFLPEKFRAAHIDQLKVTGSVFMLQLGVDIDPSEQQKGAALCYYYNSYDIESSIERTLNGTFDEGKDGFLVYCTSVHSPGMAPQGCHTMSVVTVAPNNLPDETWEKNKEQWAENFLDEIEKKFPDLRTHIKEKIILTPSDFKKRTHLKQHALGGCCPRMDSAPPTHETPFTNLWFVGAQSQSFGGVTGALTGAQTVAKKITGVTL